MNAIRAWSSRACVQDQLRIAGYPSAAPVRKERTLVWPDHFLAQGVDRLQYKRPRLSLVV